MTLAELVAGIQSRAAAIANKSSSSAVDTWAAEIVALAGQIPAAAPQIVERRSGLERRAGRDVEVAPQRRVAERRTNPWVLVEVA